MKGLEAFRNKSVYSGGKSVKILLTLDEHENIEKELKTVNYLRDSELITITKDIKNKSFYMYIGGRVVNLDKQTYDLLKGVLKNE